MMDALPNIDIAVSTDLRDFLENMAVIGEQAGHFTVERHFDTMGADGIDVINFRYLGASEHDAPGGQLIRRPDKPGRILVEMRAERWEPDPPDRETYCAVANQLMRPLLAAYNRRFAARYRMRIGKPGGKPRKLSPRTRLLFDRFANLANVRSLHPYDWRRFYALVREGRQELPDSELRRMLVEKGFPREQAERLAEIYLHLWAFKQHRW